MAQAANKNIDNASGQVVRLDIQNTLQTVATNNFGPRNSAGTILPCEFLADDTTNKLLIRKSSGGDQANPNPTSGTAADFFEVGDLDTANLGLLPKSGGTMTGALQLKVGNATSPSVHFGQTNTGIFKGASHRVSVTSDGTQVFFADSSGININSSKELRWKDSDNSNYIGFKAVSNITNSFTLTLPSADGSSGQALLTNGSGTLSFGAPTVGAANLTGNTLASGVTASSLTSVGTLSSLAVSGTCTAGTFSGSGSSLTNIPAGQLTGTVADARIASLTSSKLSGALPAIDGSALTGLTMPLSKVGSVIQSSDFTLPTGTNAFFTAGDGNMTRTVTAQSDDTYIWVQYKLMFSTNGPTSNSNNRARFKVSLYKNGVFNQDILPEESIQTTSNGFVNREEAFKFIPTSFSANDSLEVRVLHASYHAGVTNRGVFKSGSYLNVFCIAVN